jgi:hypothetical protein
VPDRQRTTSIVRTLCGVLCQIDDLFVVSTNFAVLVTSRETPYSAGKIGSERRT